MSEVKDITGCQFGRLTVLPEHERRISKSGHPYTYWKCRCECGNEVFVNRISLVQGNTKSCGCLNDEMRRKSKVRPSRFPVVHNPNRNRLYRIFNLMHNRCRDKNLKAYGGKGIKVCDEWKTYEPFHEWAMANGYAEDLTIDRIDNSKGYSPDNCRWVDRTAQANNTTKNRPITYQGETKNIGQWARELGIERRTLAYRLNTGWSIEDAFNVKPTINNNRKHYGKKVIV